MKITRSTAIQVVHCESKAIQYAIRSLQSDMENILGHAPAITQESSSDKIKIALQENLGEERFKIQCGASSNTVEISGGDDLGVILGIYYFCEHCLGVDPLKFWTDFPYPSRSEIDLPTIAYMSPEPSVRFRGWFINDEDCLMGWHDDMKISLATWEQIFESLLRSGFNMVIPGTGSKPNDPQLQLASDMGLWLTQHHAEPLGADLFSDVYPGIQPLVPEELDRFTALYRNAINMQKGRKVVWTLGFRGQGDFPFFENDPRYESPEMRGKVISDMIRLQKSLIVEMTEKPHYFVHNIYSESVTLYKEGYLVLDDDIMRVWSDNGFGAMRVRREWNTEPNIQSLPEASDNEAPAGVYYHLSYHDLQLSSKLTPIVAPSLIQDQFQQLFDLGVTQYLVVNVSNIRPHVFNISFIGRLIRFSDKHLSDGEYAIDKHYQTWLGRFFPGYESEVKALIERYHQTPFRYGNFPDELAGEEVCHHGLRNAINATVAREDVRNWYFAYPYIPESVTSNLECFEWILMRAEATLPDWISLHHDAEALSKQLAGYQFQFFNDSIRMNIDYMLYSYEGLVAGMKGLIAYIHNDFKAAFCLLSQSKWFMEDAWHTLRATEHGKWKGFYRGDWLTGTPETIRRLETIRGMCKILADAETGSWISAWIPEVLGLDGHSAIHTLIQAVADYDKLAKALLDREKGSQASILELLQ